MPTSALTFNTLSPASTLAKSFCSPAVTFCFCCSVSLEQKCTNCLLCPGALRARTTYWTPVVPNCSQSTTPNWERQGVVEDEQWIRTYVGREILSRKCRGLWVETSIGTSKGQKQEYNKHNGTWLGRREEQMHENQADAQRCRNGRLWWKVHADFCEAKAAEWYDLTYLFFKSSS